MLSKEEIKYFQTHKNEITDELLETIRAQGKLGKAQALEILDLPKDSDNYYLDAYNTRISYNGSRGLKKAYTKLNLSPIHISELEKCANDPLYFLRNYVRMTTPKGFDFVDSRPYQDEFIQLLSDDSIENVISMQPRQCIEANTKINVNGNETTIIELFNNQESNKRLYFNSSKFIESYECKDKYVETPIGKVKILEVHKTIKYNIFEIETENGFKLQASELHVLIDENGNELYVKDCLNKVIKTKSGPSKIISKTFIKYDHCYDLTLEHHHLYYTNGVLSHNSSKSTTTSVKLAHLYCFKKDINIGIVAYSGNSAREFLDKTKKMLIGLPIWMQPGTVTWNKGSIECENNIKILTDVPSSDAFRGTSTNIIVVDECAYLDPAGWIDFTDGVLPSQAGLAFKKLVILSTPKGKNHFYDIWQGAGDTLETSINGFVRHRVDWRLVPRFKSDGTKYDPEEFKQQQIKTGGLVVWNSAYECKFEGSAMTLIPSEILDTYKPQEPIEVDNIKDSKILIYEEPIPGHKYVMGVDTAKEGADFTGVQIFDITDLNFRQVASAKLKIDYMLLPELLNEYGLRFNQALIIVENNEGSGQVVADILKRDYEYENLYYDVNKQKQRLKYPGFRTTKLSRDVILQTVATLAQANKLLLVDKETIKEFGVFTLNDNGKYQAAVGYHDDLVMACCLCFGIFTNVKNFEDMKEIVDSLKSAEGKSFEYLTFGAFADGLDVEPDSNT
ncbi:Putative phage DNA packaging protein (terminase) [Campylobacter phage CPt10]|uniref:Phage DNA packaging protein (Terminase) n=2 Tax=Firehammervirus CPt10 TaxID=722418 RepID=D5GVI7_9CAUD|nr:terminase [Campylobacter phage CPt10]QAU04737.1 terminase large subunit [Campylobacter phage CP20]CBJ94203.1 Putative phage DNA packaging protein (terminase) [Campylobacter phage CPt10]